jgi:trehalose synthase
MPNRLFSVEDYEPFIGPELVDRILRKAKALQAFRVVNFNSTFYGGGVAELLSGMTLLMNSLLPACARNAFWSSER